MCRFNPDFFIHSGDQIYADGPIKSQMALEAAASGPTWSTPAKSRVAGTLDEETDLL